jgi:hypothetical protein
MMTMRDAKEFRLRHSVNQGEEDELLMAGRDTKSRLLNLKGRQRRRS